jgi:hypothetical protein
MPTEPASDIEPDTRLAQEPDAEGRCAIAETVLGDDVDWVDDATGYLECPGIELHSAPDGPRDCRVRLDGVPTVFCFHQGCSDAIAEANRELRSAIGRAEAGPSYQQQQGIRNRVQAGQTLPPAGALSGKALEKELAANDVLRARASLPLLIERFDTPPTRWAALSPTRVDRDPRHHWRQLLGLYHEDDHLWIGREVYDSSATDVEKVRFFRPVAEWLQRATAPGKFTCPSTFQPGVHSRSNEFVAQRPFLVCESDVLRKREIGAVFQWMRTFMLLRAIVDTAGKSLHGWFDFPDADTFRELQIILPALGLDPALFKASQPCRLPGALREGRFQTLLFLDTEGVQP